MHRHGAELDVLLAMQAALRAIVIRAESAGRMWISAPGPASPVLGWFGQGAVLSVGRSISCHATSCLYLTATVAHRRRPMTAGPAGRHARLSPGSGIPQRWPRSISCRSSDGVPAAMKVTIPLRARRHRCVLCGLNSGNRQPCRPAAPELTATPFCSCPQQGTWPAREAMYVPGRQRASHARSRKDCHSRRSLGTLMRCRVAGTPLRRLAAYPRHVDPRLIVLLLILSRCEQGREDHRADATFTAERPLR
jgi:hypothetical protein